MVSDPQPQRAAPHPRRLVHPPASLSLLPASTPRARSFFQRRLWCRYVALVVAGVGQPRRQCVSPLRLSQDAFARAEILPVSTGGDAQDVGLIAAAMRRSRGGVGSVSLKLEVYLPNRTPMAVEVRASASVHDVIVAVLKQHRAERRRPALRDGSNCYELRLHEEDGYPDEDFPALDRARQISNFAQGGAHEYCLCEIPGMKPTVTTSTRNLQRMQSLAAFKCIKIIMCVHRARGGRQATSRVCNVAGRTHPLFPTPS